MREIPKPYEIYRHFKGKCYQVQAIATHSETGEQMVVYQQLYAPYGVYVRPLEMFLSKVDKENYPKDIYPQEYRFEKIQDAAWAGSTCNGTEECQEEPQLDEGLLAFLEADSYEKKLEILHSLHPTITDSMIDTMAVSLDIEVADGDIETRYTEIRNCLLTMERFECNRLRG